jgi:membrane-bound ClpP family serine protease
MLFKPVKVRALVQKAGSTPFINYAELLLRMIPAAALIIYADYSKYPGVFTLVGCIMLITSVILLMVPVSTHHRISSRFANFLQPRYFQLISPFSLGFGYALIDAVS